MMTFPISSTRNSKGGPSLLLKLDATNKEIGIKSIVNSTNNPFVHFLPPELVSKIFIFCIPKDELLNHFSSRPNVTPIRVGAVCKAWRAISWSTPRLWAAFHIIINPNNVHLEFSLTNLYLARSGLQPLSIHVKMPAKFLLSDGQEELWDPIWHSLGTHSERWQTLELDVPSTLLPRLRHIGQSSPQLQTLLIRNSDHSQNNVRPRDAFEALRILPRPVTIRVFGLYFSAVRIDWSHITRVDIWMFTYDECLELFRRAPNITCCEIYFLNNCYEGHAIPEAFLVHPTLQKLKTMAYVPDFLFDKLALPGLHDLKLGGRSLSNGLQNLFIRSSCCLSKLSLEHMNGSGVEILSLLRLVPFLEELRFHVFWFTNPAEYSYDQLFEYLGATAALPNGHGSASLPRLKSFSCLGGNLDIHRWSWLPAIFPPEQELANLHYRPFRELRLTMYIKKYEDTHFIDHQILVRLSDITERGFTLSILNQERGEEDFIQRSLRHHEGSRNGKTTDSSGED